MNRPTSLPRVPQWSTHEILLTAQQDHARPYVEVEVWATFTNEQGDTLHRPAFWDGGQNWKVRFAPPDSQQRWTWRSTSKQAVDPGLHGQSGALQAVPYTGADPLLRHGLLTMSPGKRNVVHHDGQPFLLVGDTPWALPFRATQEQVQRYAQDRRTKGFNAALLMTVQPDMKAQGPNARDTEQGFARGFADLSSGHLNAPDSAYFQYLDSLVDILLSHGIVPVYQPVFHGFGWKGKTVLGKVVPPEEYLRYVRYLLARYGSRPACWLLAADHDGRGPGVRASGEMMEAWDAYQQPTGLHYNPYDDYRPWWALFKKMLRTHHHNQSYQEEDWLDFQWAQTGHASKHLYHKVRRMYDHPVVKAVANGEPTYEGMGGGREGLGWWQGEEAWMQLMSGGTMGVVYGAAGLWQWKVSADEAGWGNWASQPKSWAQALDLEGSRYVGYVGQALQGYDWVDMERRWDLTPDGVPLLAKEGRFYLAYLRQGGTVVIPSLPADLPYRWFDPQRGQVAAEGITQAGAPLAAPEGAPWVLLVGERNEGKDVHSPQR
jgi:hypothetical protein